LYDDINLKNVNYKFIMHDIIKPITLNDSYDEIYNLACPASPHYYSTN